jgi:hypothetical protein
MNILCFLLFSQLYSCFLKSQFTFSGGMTVQHILGLVRRCVEDYHMIEAGETVAVGVSGGKDSLLTLTALARLRAFYPLPFQVEAITLETGMPGMDGSSPPSPAWSLSRAAFESAKRSENPRLVLLLSTASAIFFNTSDIVRTV